MSVQLGPSGGAPASPPDAAPHDGTAPPPAASAPPAPPEPQSASAAQPESAEPQSAEAAAPAPRRRRLRRVLLLVGVCALLVAAAVGAHVYQDSLEYVSTDNAQLTGEPVQVGSMNAGRLDTINVRVGSYVHKNDVLAVVEIPSQIGVAQNGQPEMGFVGAGDSHVNVTSPLDGVVIAVPQSVGSTVQAGQNIVSLVDPTQLYVNANIDETQISRVQPGQYVTVHVDALNADVPGRVDSITPATAAIFSLLPTNNTSGNFTKVTQEVPVRIDVSLGNQPALLGASVEVKIDVGH